MQCKLSTKLFLAFAALTFSASIATTGLVYAFFAEQKRNNFLSQYELFNRLMIQSFRQLEELSDAKRLESLAALDDVITLRGELPDDAELDILAQRYGVKAFYILDGNGRFLRSSDLPIEEQVNSIFDYCDDYRKLVTGQTRVEQTPVLPSFPDLRPQKFTIVPATRPQTLLESSGNLEYISRTLQQAFQEDQNIAFLGLYAPNGYELGSIDRNGNFHEGRQNVLSEVWYGARVTPEQTLYSTRLAASQKRCCECKMKGTGTQAEDEPYTYTLRLAVSMAPLNDAIAQLRRYVAVILLIVLAVCLAVSYALSRHLLAGLDRISAAAKAITKTGDLSVRVSRTSRRDEIADLGLALNQMVAHLQHSQERLVEGAKAHSLARLSCQVAHDIRSPLAALDAVVPVLSPHTSEESIIARTATRRIHDIANNLLSFHRGDAQGQSDRVQAEPLVAMVQSLLSEKRAQYIRSDLDFEVQVTPRAQGTFVRVKKAVFQAALSNLLNNAAEATGTQGTVRVILDAQSDTAIIDVSDMGCGMSPEQLEKALAGGVSTKAGGSGIGLSSSVRAIGQWGGRAHVTSTCGRGTTVRVMLPSTPPPSWFAPTLSIDASKLVVVLDDEDFIAKLWENRLMQEANGRVRLHKFRRCADFVAFFLEHRHAIGLCLIDYQFIDDTRTGTDLIAQLDCADRSILVTSYVDDVNVRACCEKLGLKILPKGAAASVPIILQASAEAC